MSDSATWITPTAGILGALITGLFAWYVPAWKVRRETHIETARALRHTRDPLLRATFELQSRLYNIVAKDFLKRYLKHGSADEQQYAALSTLWIIGQYLGWVEILRREVQYLDLGSRMVNRRLQLRLSAIATVFASDERSQEDSFILFRADQRAIGEFMVTSRTTETGHHRPDCLGYSEFLESLQAARSQTLPQAGLPRPPIVAWTERCSLDLENAAGAPEKALRLVNVQRLLIDLVDLLDPDRVRYPDVNLRGKLPAISNDVPSATRVARFLWRNEPWPLIERWAEEHRLRSEAQSSNTRIYRGGLGPTCKRLQVVARYEDGWVTLDAGMMRRGKTSAIGGALRNTPGRLAINKLLKVFDRPTIADGSTLPCRIGRWGFNTVGRLRGVDDYQRG